jgi:UDP-N-acetylglucosamine--N-acetylmuramyl-(pentapeptide) pyrophosphoryl-undecaprenol N-acetylglucosamine transferase
MKILVSGGHLTPALALIDFVRQHTSDHVIFVGRLYSQTQQKQKAREQEEVEKRGVKFIPFQSGKFDDHSLLVRVFQFLLIGKGFFQALAIFSQEKPDVFVSFGGYLALPLAMSAYIKHVPIITHEQTRTAGVANRWIAKIATKVAVTFPETLHFFPKEKTVLTGNPIRQSIFEKNAAQPQWLEKKNSLPLLYITGGSQGSQMINTVVCDALPHVVQNWQVIHQCGNSTLELHYKEDLEKARALLPKNLQDNYVVREWLSEAEQSWIYHYADGVISRAGANTVQELAFFAVPTIFIPLPYTHGDEQEKNASALVKEGGALLISQEKLTTGALLQALDTLKKNAKTFTKQAQAYRQQLIMDGDKKLYTLVQEVVHVHHAQS